MGILAGWRSLRTFFIGSIILITIILFAGQTEFLLSQYRQIIDNHIKKELSLTAENKVFRLNDPFTRVSKTVEALSYDLEAMTDYDNDILLYIMGRYISQEPFMYGSGFWLKPYELPGQKYYGPYVHKRSTGTPAFTWDYSTPEYDYFSWDWYKSAINSPNRISWTAPYYDDVSAVNMITAAAQIIRDGRIVGLATIDVDLSQVESFVDTLSDESGAYTVLFGPDGTPLAYPGKSAAPSLDELRQLGQQIIAGKKQAVLRLPLQNVDSFVSYVPVSIGGLYLAIIMPSKDAYRSLHYMTALSAGGVLVAISLFVMLMIILYNRKVDRPVQALLAAVEQVGRGNLTTPVNWQSPDEFGLLARAIDQMRQQRMEAENLLAQSRNELEQTVATRTQELQQANLNLVSSNSELQYTLEELKDTQAYLIRSEKMAALGGLVAGMAHEINTPVGIGITTVTHLNELTGSLLSRYHDGKLTRHDMEEYLENCQESCRLLENNLQRAAKLIASFRQVAVDQSSEKRQQFLLRPYLEEILLSLRPWLKKTSLTVHLDCDDHLLLDSYPGAFVQILSNLISNSITHAYEPLASGTISISVLLEETQWVLTYADDGNGIDAETLPHILNPFYTTRRGSGNPGLGLYIVYNLVTSLLQGTLEYHSTAGKGTTFIIRAPLLPPAE